MLCDVIPLDACRLLLGWPCKYEWNMIYDGHDNIVMVWKDGVQWKLVPLPESEDDEKNQNIYWEKRELMCLTKEFLEVEKK